MRNRSIASACIAGALAIVMASLTQAMTFGPWSPASSERASARKADRAQGARHAALGKEPVEAIEGPQIGADRPLGPAFAAQVEDPVVARAGEGRAVG